MPSESRLFLTSSSISADSRSSSTHEIIGYMRRTRPNADARRMARSCVRKTSRWESR